MFTVIFTLPYRWNAWIVHWNEHSKYDWNSILALEVLEQGVIQSQQIFKNKQIKEVWSMIKLYYIKILRTPALVRYCTNIRINWSSFNLSSSRIIAKYYIKSRNLVSESTHSFMTKSCWVVSSYYSVGLPKLKKIFSICNISHCDEP